MEYAEEVKKQEEERLWREVDARNQRKKEEELREKER